MEQQNVFLSVGGTATDKQEQFLLAIENRLRSEGLIPNTVGRNNFSSDSPLKSVNEVMDKCCGTLIIALERTYFPKGMEKRGGNKEKKLNETKYPTPWNQIEAAMAYTRNHPLMLIVEKGLKSEGILERGHDWYVMWIKPDEPSLTSTEFNGVLASWKKKVEQYQVDKIEVEKAKINVAELTIGELLKTLKPAQLWTMLTALVGLLAGAFALGQFLST